VHAECQTQMIDIAVDTNKVIAACMLLVMMATLGCNTFASSSKARVAARGAAGYYDCIKQQVTLGREITEAEIDQGVIDACNVDRQPRGTPYGIQSYHNQHSSDQSTNPGPSDRFGK
jgi:hypothetical protein